MLRITTTGAAGALLLGTLTAVPAYADEQASITLAASPDSVDPDRPTTTITGKVVGADGAPAGGVAVDLSSGAGEINDATTETDGTFTATLRSNGEGNGGVAVWAYVPTLQIRSDYLIVKIVRVRPEMTLVADRTRLDEGRPLTLSGSLSYHGKPVSWRRVYIDPGSHGNCSAPMYRMELQTDADGRFSRTFKPTCTAGYTAHSTEGGFYEATSASLARIAVRPATKISLAATMDAFGRFQASGGLQAPSAGGDMNGKQVLLEYSPNSRTGWKVIRRMKISYGQFSARFQVNNSGYWRARFAGDTTAQPSTSPVRKTWRWTTRMSKLKASPTRVRKNRYIAVSGTLSRWYPAKNGLGAFPGQKVRIIFRFRGKKTWYHAKWVKTDRKGRYSAKVRAYGDSYFAAIFAGTRDTWATGTLNDRYVDTYAVPAPQRPSGPPPVITVQPWRSGQ
ncbi:Ig-like domain-containing protein [Actinomadura fulvescens]|uniref:Carboxypeptidase regulatory-like domain-containing protein n=1 Tax=Actinomadura fulvescens TaxID=46160 RepID=A0ABN3Q1I6_9ACTN